MVDCLSQPIGVDLSREQPVGTASGHGIFLNVTQWFLTHLYPPFRSIFAVRETASLGMMGETRVPPLNPSETIVL